MTMGIIDGKPTVAYQLFNHLFAVKIQNMFLYSGANKRHRSGFNSEDQEIEAQTRNESTEVYRTPVGMALLFQEGKVPYIVKREDVLTIYELITKHLNNWANEIRNPVSVLTPPPPRDLLCLENFSQYIYEDAMFELESKNARDRINSHDNTLANFLALFGGRSNLNTITTSKSTDPASLRSIAEAWDAITW